MKSVYIALFAGTLAAALISAPADAAKFGENTVYSFCSQPNCADGSWPEAGLVNFNGALYGSTTYGGVGSCSDYFSGCGTVFSIDPGTGAETALYSFCQKSNCDDGANPEASLVAAHGILYGTTNAGGGYGGTTCSPFGCGTVFSLDPNTGVEKVLYSFCSQANCADGASPVGSLVRVGGLLYGTTQLGGITGCFGGAACGTVFSIDPKTHVHKVLYAFCSQPNCADGEWPVASLIAAKGLLYGTTAYGGLTGCGGATTCGTVFEIDPGTGSEKVLYSFCSQSNCTDGAIPTANLIDRKGMLYGTTIQGGLYGCDSMPPGCGTAFALDPSSGTETVLHSFGSGEDGYFPNAALIDVRGTLYGTTQVGGSQHAGTAFTLDPTTGAEKVIWSFCGSDCYNPSNLIDVDGKFYGTTSKGGSSTSCSGSGCGMVFVISKEH